MKPAADREQASWGPPPWALAVALVGVVAGLAWWWPDDVPPPPPARAARPAAPVQSAPPAAAAPAATVAVMQPPAPVAPLPRIPRLRDPNGDQTPDLADYVNEGERPTMAEAIQRLHAAGVRSGLGAFNPPGTRPPILGLAVPESFELPPGYVRHHQATDDGQRIEAVLMFAPDMPTLVVNGRTVAVPADRVVPPELAPPGLPLRRVVVPAPLDAPR